MPCNGYPFQLLLPLVDTRLRDRDLEPSNLNRAAFLGIHPRQILRWVNSGARLQLATADRLAVRLHTHPGLIWPDYWHHDPDDKSKSAAMKDRHDDDD